jgi:hypothetical protein
VYGIVTSDGYCSCPAGMFVSSTFACTHPAVASRRSRVGTGPQNPGVHDLPVVSMATGLSSHHVNGQLGGLAVWARAPGNRRPAVCGFSICGLGSLESSNVTPGIAIVTSPAACGDDRTSRAGR